MLVGTSGPLAGQQPAHADTARQQSLAPVKITGRVTNLVGVAISANQGTVGATDIALRPILRPGEIVENVPGVIVTQHSGSGKANQYFLRGFNLDHGTDLALSVDGIPVNLPSHAHGQGYADLNFLIPELVERVDFGKGPYDASVGDFGSAGSMRVHLLSRLGGNLLVTDAGQYGYRRVVAAAGSQAGAGNVLWGGEAEHNDGPWTVGENARKLNGLVRYARGDDANGFTATAMAYHDIWHSADQIPDRAIAAGRMSRWGLVDSTDGGVTGRYALSAEWHRRSAGSAWQVETYAFKYDLDLFSDFTYFLDDPLHGDQVEQRDGRTTVGGSAVRSWLATALGRPTRTAVGVSVRRDAVRNGLYHTEARARLADKSVDDIVEANAGPYAENRTDWTSWFRTTLGVRGDLFHFDVQNRAGGASGNRTAADLSPKAALVFGPWSETEFYLDGGYGYHSNDARGVVARADRATPLARSRGAEVGVRNSRVRGLRTSLSLWMLDLQSELVWDGDAGGNEPSGPTRRYGVEFANYYTPRPWLTVDADYAWSHARYTDHEADGDFVPEALVATFDGGVAVHDLTGPWRRASGGLRWRYFGPRPLTQDGAINSQATSLLYADFGYRLTPRWTVALNAFNLLDTRASDIDYYYESRLPGEPAAGVLDLHTHPVEPRSLRLSLRAGW
jgi:hypothetical protein